MRTKALVCAAVIAASAVTSMAQVYSQNIVGYVNVPVTGNNALDFLSVPLKPANGNFSIANTIALTDDAAGASIYTWAGDHWADIVPQWYAGYGWYAVDGEGTEVTVEIPNGQAFFLQSPVAQTITFVGEVNTGTLNYSLAPGLTAIANKAAVNERFPGETVGAAGDTLIMWGGSAWQDETFSFYDGYGWYSGSGGPDDVPAGPMLPMGKGMFYQNVNAQLNFSKTFNP